MEADIMAFMNLYEVFGYIQGQAWSALPGAAGKRVGALNNRQIKAMMVVYMRHAAGREPLTLNQLAGFLNLKKAAASLLVSDLVEKKLVDRAVDPANRRFIRITLAGQGRKIGDAVAAQAALRVGALLECLTGEERSALVRAAEKVYQRYSLETEGAA